MTSSLFNDFSFTLLARLSVLSLSPCLSSRSPREDGFGYRSIEGRGREGEGEKITKILTNGSCLLLLILVVLLHFLHLLLSLCAWFLPLIHSASVIFYMMLVREVKNDFPTRPSFFSPDRRFVLMSSSSFTCSNSVRNYLVSFSLSSSNHNSLYVLFSEQIESHRQEKERSKREREREREIGRRRQISHQSNTIERERERRRKKRKVFSLFPEQHHQPRSLNHTHTHIYAHKKRSCNCNNIRQTCCSSAEVARSIYIFR